MPILVECPGCGARLHAPDAGAGKKVRCPKPHCGALIPVPALLPAEEVVDAVPALPPERDADRPRRRDEYDEDERPRRRRRDDDEDDRPRRRREYEDDDRPRRGRELPRRRRGMGAAAVVAVVIGSVLALGGVGYGVYALLGGSKTPIPPGWKEYAYKEDGFKAAFPKEPKVHRVGDPFAAFTQANPAANAGGFGGIPGLGGGDLRGGSMTMYSSGEMSEAVNIQVFVYQFPSGVPAAYRDITRGFDAMPGAVKELGIEVKTVRWMGAKAAEVTTPAGVMRMAVTDKAVYQAMISGKNFGGRATPEEEKGFFDNFVPAR